MKNRRDLVNPRKRDAVKQLRKESFGVGLDAREATLCPAGESRKSGVKSGWEASLSGTLLQKGPKGKARRTCPKHRGPITTSIQISG